MDGDSRGGAALSVREVSGKPVKFVGIGEKMDALEPFYPERMAQRILGMGDMLTLYEKAQEAIKVGLNNKGFCTMWRCSTDHQCNAIADGGGGRGGTLRDITIALLESLAGLQIMWHDSFHSQYAHGC
jgi:hypothetical protein